MNKYYYFTFNKSDTCVQQITFIFPMSLDGNYRQDSLQQPVDKPLAHLKDMKQ